MPDEVIVEIEEYAVYTGNEEDEDVRVMEKQIVIKPEQKGWVKRKADRNCLSHDPEDCMVWCLVDEEAVVRTVLVVDTTQTKNFKIERIEREVDRISGGGFEWKEVVCEKNLSPDFWRAVQTRLADKGYYDREIDGKLSKTLKDALKQFQKENSLPLGQLDYETLDVLGVVIN